MKKNNEISKLDSEIKNTLKSKINTNNTGQIKIRFSSFEELQLLKNFEKYCTSKNISKNKLYKDILISWIKKQEKQKVFDELENNIYMGLNKAIFYRTQGINKTIISETRPISFETQLISEKINLILNLILKQTSISDPKNITPSSIDELIIFKKSRKSFNLATKESLKSIEAIETSSKKWTTNYQKNTINNLSGEINEKTKQ